MAVVWLTVVLLLARFSSSEAKKRLACTRLNITLCNGLNYKWTSFPNPITQIKDQETTAKFTKLYPQLAMLNCTNVNPVPFLCSVYAPKCYPKMKRNVIPPCREFCEQASGHCPTAVARFGIQWPEPLNCTRYPKAGGEYKCISDSNFNIVKGKKRRNKNPLTIRDCCRLGVKTARKGYQCALPESTSTAAGATMNQENAFKKRVAKQCPQYKANFQSCCANAKTKMERKAERLRQKEQRKKTRQDKIKTKLNKNKNRKSRKGKKSRNGRGQRG